MNQPYPCAQSGDLRIALVGCGKMGLQHLKALRAIAGCTVTAIADPAIDRNAAQSAAGHELSFFDDFTSLLTAARPQAVHVVTPPASHANLARQALEAGCHVYVEKPFAATLEEANDVVTLAKNRGLLVCAGHQCLFERPALRALEQLPAIGRMIHVTSYFSFRQLRRNLTPIEQCKDILPHAVYPLLRQIRATGENAAIEIVGCDARTSGDLYALLRIGSCTGNVAVSLSGRPIEQFQDIVASNGSLRVDYVTGKVIRLHGPGTGPGMLLTPFRRGLQMLGGANGLLFRVLTGRGGSYSGLHELMHRFYAAIAAGGPAPVTPAEICDTVDVCARLGQFLDSAELETESAASNRLQVLADRQPEPLSGRLVLITGGTGFLGRHVAAEVRGAGFRTRVIARRVPPASARVPGVDYRVADLGTGIDDSVLEGVTDVVHCAAETAGGEREHERNSIGATRNLMAALARAGIRRIVHVSSLAVLKPSYRARRPVDERTLLGADARERGPYAWGKAESERQISLDAIAAGIELRIIRPGPLVDYDNYQPPGRLGREIGPIFVAIGGRGSRLPVCEVRTAARVIRSYLQDFSAAPPLVNLTEAALPTRKELLSRHLARRGDLSVWWFPGWLLRLLSSPAKLAQRLLLRIDRPVDIYAVFAGGHYRTDLAAEVISRAGQDPTVTGG